MKVYYFKIAAGNFGDDLNAWLWDELLPGVFDDDESLRFAGIGTILSSSLPQAKNWIVFSSGVGYGRLPYNFGGEGWDIVSVRGPLSAHILGLPKEKAITDGAALLASLPEFQPLPEAERSGTIFIPHHDALHTGRWQQVCEMAGIEFVSPQNESKYVINKIRKAKLVLADAMHAAIIADAMRVPWVPLVTSDQINTFKWLDWTQTIQQGYNPLVLGGSSMREAWRNKSLPFYGEKYFYPNADIDTVINEFIRARKLKNKSWWPKYTRYSRYFTANAPDRMFQRMENKSPRSWDNAYMERASERLARASESTSYLSEDAVFNDNLQKLQEKLLTVKNYVKPSSV
ncbi:exosortase [Erwinia typographi]|uniref:Exosortase n=1 Tax=Erwinia typographi TaxID=371042 RepID=A0A0A3ZDE8_9GAMM|nr:polysaccharide pyruvyl transferase family protein [Erwinia typographi]KGT95834.1 exosortase [Erwinia typographi]